MNFPIWILLGLGSAFSAALVAIFGKLGLEKVDTTLATTARAAVMFLLLLIFVAATGRLTALGSISGRALLFIVLAGVAGAASWLFYFWGLKLGPANGLVAMDRLSIVMVVILAAIFLGEKLTWTVAAGAALMVGGAILIAL
jgi:transporter family protein